MATLRAADRLLGQIKTLQTEQAANAEVARVSSRYAVQGHLRSLTLVPIESQYNATFY